MKYKAKYGAESEIPAEVKSFYILQGGEWIFNGTDFEGLDALLNPGLAANRDALKLEKKAATDERDAVVKERDSARLELSKVSKPGSIVMDVEEQKLLEEYKALGTVKDVQTKLENEKTVSEKLGLMSQADELRQLAKDTGLNEDAFLDFKLNSERGKNVSLASEKRKIKDEKTGKEEEKLVPVVKITNNVNGKDQVETKLFSDYAKENHYPDYLVTAIFNGQSVTEDKGKTKTFVAPPSLSRTTTSDTGKPDVNKVVARMNEERSTRKMPWSTAPEKTETT